MKNVLDKLFKYKLLLYQIANELYENILKKIVLISILTGSDIPGPDLLLK